MKNLFFTLIIVLTFTSYKTIYDEIQNVRIGLLFNLLPDPSSANAAESLNYWQNSKELWYNRSSNYQIYIKNILAFSVFFNNFKPF